MNWRASSKAKSPDRTRIPSGRRNRPKQPSVNPGIKNLDELPHRSPVQHSHSNRLNLEISKPPLNREINKALLDREPSRLAHKMEINRANQGKIRDVNRVINHNRGIPDKHRPAKTEINRINQASRPRIRKIRMAANNKAVDNKVANKAAAKEAALKEAVRIRMGINNRRPPNRPAHNSGAA